MVLRRGVEQLTGFAHLQAIELYSLDHLSSEGRNCRIWAWVWRSHDSGLRTVDLLTALAPAIAAAM